MLRVTDDALSEEGFPFVYWEHDVPTGQSLHSVQQSMDLKIAAVIMVFVFVFVFVAVYAWSEQFWGAVIAAMIVGGMDLGGDRMLKGGIKVWDEHIPGPPDPPPEAAEAAWRARAMPVLGKQYRGLEVVSYGDAQQLHLCVAHGSDPKAMEWFQLVPLASIQSLELGTADEWFEGISQVELRRTVSAPNYWVIVAPTLGHGVLWIAELAGSKAGIAALHGLLTKRFVVDAPEMLQRWKEELEEREARTITIAGAPADNHADAGTTDKQEQGTQALSRPAAGEGDYAARADNREK